MELSCLMKQTTNSVRWQHSITLNNSISNLHDLTEKPRTAINHPVQQHGSKLFFETNDKQCDINDVSDILLNDMSMVTYL